MDPECSQVCSLLENYKGAASRYYFEVVGCVLEFVKVERKFTFSGIILLYIPLDYSQNGNALMALDLFKNIYAESYKL